MVRFACGNTVIKFWPWAQYIELEEKVGVPSRECAEFLAASARNARGEVVVASPQECQSQCELQEPKTKLIAPHANTASSVHTS